MLINYHGFLPCVQQRTIFKPEVFLPRDNICCRSKQICTLVLFIQMYYI